MKTYVSVFAALSLTVLSGCNDAKAPDAVASDVATAQAKAASETADAQRAAAQDSNAAAAKVDEKTKDLNQENAKGAFDVANTKADGDHKVASEKCKALAGEQQKACLQQADARYDLAKANAKAALAEKTQQN